MLQERIVTTVFTLLLNSSSLLLVIYCKVVETIVLSQGSLGRSSSMSSLKEMGKPPFQRYCLLHHLNYMFWIAHFITNANQNMVLWETCSGIPFLCTILKKAFIFKKVHAIQLVWEKLSKPAVGILWLSNLCTRTASIRCKHGHMGDSCPWMAHLLQARAIDMQVVISHHPPSFPLHNVD